MVVCPHCATPIPDGSNFCSHCGTPVPGQPLDSPTLTPQGREIFDRLKQATEGRYEVLRELGRGGMAVVFLAYQKSLDRQIAIKVLLPILAYDPEIVERFQREARTQGRLDHPSIISVYEVYNEGGLTFFTMPYISGRSLRAYLEDEPQPPIERVHRFLSQAADALAYAHRRGVVHRDIKPDNILIDEERSWVILTDFGIAKALSAESTLTTPGDLLGTPHYMSPEQGEGKLDLDGRADQYSLGLIGYEMLAGRRPFKADTLAELMYMHRFEEPESLDRLCPDIPQSLRDVIKRAISKDREDRFRTMEGFLAALEATEYEAEEQDVTEPMPPPGSDDTTVRIPTPPGRQAVAPTPAPVDDTTPETSEPPSAPETAEPEPGVETREPWAAPEPVKARAEPDTPPPWTPTPAVEPWARPVEEAEPSITPEPGLGEPERAEAPGGGAPAVGAIEVAAAAERPRGMPRPLLVGGGAAAVLLVGALFLFGPLRSRALRQPAEESVAEIGAREGQAGPAAEAGLAEPERGPVAEAGPAGDVQVAGGSRGRPRAVRRRQVKARSRRRRRPSLPSSSRWERPLWLRSAGTGLARNRRGSVRKSCKTPPLPRSATRITGVPSISSTRSWPRRASSSWPAISRTRSELSSISPAGTRRWRSLHGCVRRPGRARSRESAAPPSRREMMLSHSGRRPSTPGPSASSQTTSPTRRGRRT